MPRSRTFRPFRTAGFLSLVIGVASCGWFGGTPQGNGGGGTLRATYRTEPTNYIRMAVVATAPNQMLSLLTQATLVRANASGELEPRLATQWSVSPDGRIWTVDLRRDAKFSDGTPVTAADVIFTLTAALTSPAQADVKIGGQPITAQMLDDYRVAFTFPAPSGAGMAIFENLYILPRHKLDAANGEGTLAAVWTMNVAPSEVVGAGPFVIAEYVPGQRLRFERNPHFFGRDAEGRGLPYLDAIDMAIVPDYDAEILRLQGGDTDVIMEVATPDDFASLEVAKNAGRVQLADAGPAIDVVTMWFDLKPGAKSAAGRPWLQKAEFRRAISHAVNRQAIVDTVYAGQALPAYGPVTPGHGPWYVPDLPTTPFDQERARTLLSAIGLRDRNGDGQMEDEKGAPVRFSVLNRAGATDRERTLTVVQEHLRQIGITLDVVNLTQTELLARMGSGDFDAIYFGGRATNRQPSASFWTSSGGFHYWHPMQTTPATPWEARIDELFQQQAAMSDLGARAAVFAEAQRLLADNLPALWFVAPRVIIPVSGRVRGATPTIIFPPILWNAEQLSLANGGR